MKKTKLFLSILVLLAVGITGWSVINNEDQKENDNFSENLEALTLPPEENPGGSEIYPGYYNDTKHTVYTDKKVEYKKDSAGVSIKIHFIRTCTSHYTYCKHSGKSSDVCYGSLNGLVTDCGEWKEE